VLFGELREVRLGPAVLDVPVLASVDLVALGLAVVAAVVLFGLRWGLVGVLGVTSAVGLVVKLALG
jgi:chromate transporter